ncbi:MAG TPA: hypothetical protein VM487_18955 [Phycisphaerae bacterium]|nr:hypothetical protein [Phycisphaerae bacterium]
MTDSRDWMRMELEKVRTIEADNAALRERAEQAEDVLAGLTDVIRTAEREHLNRFDGTADLRAVVARLGYRDVGTLAALRERVRVLEDWSDELRDRIRDIHLAELDGEAGADIKDAETRCRVMHEWRVRGRPLATPDGASGEGEG